MTKKKEAKVSFNDNLLRLEEISRKLEDDDLDLEESITLYEEGVELSKLCIETLKNAELKITSLKTKLDSIAQLIDDEE
ncbi:MAG: exodeoxyribonuclease VII small subunit [Ignavibacteriaceae bacterium]|nr:exodeoxyribonuclease VII small subunit [Ignavibacteriaceae bacterium]HRI47551.1 exodeoxyribonuclease VII small subunit [Ignavibacteriaceae bacterium]